MNIAHISDIHFFNQYFHPSNLLSGSWIGKLNALFRRKNTFITKHLDIFINSMVKEEVDLLIITGDLTTTSDPKEFAEAKKFIKKIIQNGIRVYALPGNHDTYTKCAIKEQRFYRYLDMIPAFSNNKLHYEIINPCWDLVLLDNTILNNPFKANGLFSEDHEKKLEDILKKSSNMIICNHFPLTDPSKNHRLIHGDKLKSILEAHKNSVLYLHGHTHKTSYEKGSNHLHIFNSSESCLNKKFKYHIIELTGTDFTYKEIKYYE